MNKIFIKDTRPIHFTTIGIEIKGQKMTPRCPKCGKEATSYHNAMTGVLVAYDCVSCNITDVENYTFVGVDMAAEAADKSVQLDLGITNINPHLNIKVCVEIKDGQHNMTHYVDISFDYDEDSFSKVMLDFDKDIVLVTDSFSKTVFSGKLTDAQVVIDANKNPNALYHGKIIMVTDSNTLDLYYYTGKQLIKLIEDYK